MTHQNLVLTEKAIKNHSKRLQKQLKNYNQNLSLCEVQTILSKTLGFKDWKHLSIILGNKLTDSQLSLNLSNINEKQKENLIKDFITQENLIDLKKIINYSYTKSSEPFSGISPRSFGGDLISILTQSRYQSISFQESIAIIVIDILKQIEDSKRIKAFDSEDLMATFSRMKIKLETFDQIIKIYPFKKNDFNVGIVVACEHNNVELVQHLLLTYNVDIDNFFYIGDYPTLFNPLCSSILANSHETIDLLLNSLLLKQNADIRIEDSHSLKMACREGNIQLVKFLLTSNTLKFKANMYAENCICIIYACEHDHWNVVSFLLNEMNIDLKPDFYSKITRKFKFFTDSYKQNKLKKMILKLE